MAFDENPDEVFDNEPDAELEGNGDEQSNRSFRMMMIGLFALGGLGVLAIVFALLLRQGGNDQVTERNAIIQATNDAIIAQSQISPTPLPTDTPAPTNTAAPTNTPAPTATPRPKDLIDTALSSSEFSTLSSLLRTAGLVEALKAQGPFTIFAPTNDAFAQLSPETLDALNKDPEKLATLLKYHVVQGAIKANDAATINEAQTLEGEPVELVTKDGTLQVNNAMVTKPDQQTANGVIHTIDRVLVPPELSKDIVVLAPPTPRPGAAQSTPAAGRGTAVAAVQGTAAANATAKPATGAQGTAVVATRVPPQAATATAAAAKVITNTGTMTTTAGTGTDLPKTGANDNLFMLVLAAVGLVGVLVVARRLRTSPS